MGIQQICTLLLLSILSLSIVDTFGQASHRSSYDEFCNETIKCDKRAWLSCQSSKCACMLDDMVYDQVKYKCLSKSGERCRFQISEVGGDKNMFALYENTECVSNAHCDNGFTCTCQDGYFETVDGTCLAQKDNKFSCSTNVECKQDKFLICAAGICQCSTADDHIYDKSNETGSDVETCVGKAGKLLRKQTKCVTGSILQNGVCVCVPETQYYAGLDGICYQKVEFMESCTRDEECFYERQFLSCVNGKCGCNPITNIHQTFRKSYIKENEMKVEVYQQHYSRPDNDFHAYYTYPGQNIVYGTWIENSYNNYEVGFIRSKYNVTLTEILNQCVGLANQPCNPEFNCITDSTCDVSKSNNAGTCKCNTGFSPTSMSSCGTGHGRECSAAAACSDIFRCTDGICDCPQFNHQIYDIVLKQCVGLVSSFCSFDSDCCQNSVCIVNSKTKIKQCVCKQGHVESSVGTCDKAWGTTCNYDSMNEACDRVAGLKCRNGICECPDVLSQFDSKIRKCLGLVGSRCSLLNQTDDINNVIQGFARLCVDGAECFQEHTKVAGQCLCSGYGVTMTKEMTCTSANESTEDIVTTDQIVEISTTKPYDRTLLPTHRIFDRPERIKADSTQIAGADIINT